MVESGHVRHHRADQHDERCQDRPMKVRDVIKLIEQDGWYQS
jgi:hypothetical protein